MIVGKQFRILGLACAMALLASGASMTLAENDRSPRIIRPPDDRTDFYATTSMLQGIGNSVCAQITTDLLVDNGDGTFTINAGTLGTDFDPLCNGERFSDQPTAASCTATLVGDDILITAGHCLDDAGTRTDLSTIYFVFDYAVRQQNVNPETFTTDQVFRATEILGLANVDGTANDWAVVKLDRKVTGRTPVTVRSTGAIAEAQSIVAIGFGAGLPMKFSGNATVQAIVEFGFEADLDIIGGNSGGPIIDATTGMIEGVVSADQAIEDYFQDGTCFRAAVCPQDPQCDDSFTLLSSIMTADFQSTIQTAIAGSNTGGGTDGGTGTDPNGDTTDADNDGVADEDDLCAATPADAEVDSDGCELDDATNGNDNSGGTTGSPAPCGVTGFIPFTFMMLGLTLIRRRR